MHQVIKLTAQNSYTFTWDGLENSAGDFVNDADMRMTLRDSAGNALTQLDNVQVPYIAGSNGRYEGVIPWYVGLVAGDEYTLEVSAVFGDADGFRTFEVEVLDPQVADQVVTIYRMNDNTITWDGMEDSEGEFVNDATVTMTLRDPAGNTVPQVVGSVLNFVAGSNGRYQGAISSNVGLTAQSGYVLEVKSVDGSNQRLVKYQTQVLDRTT